MIDSTANSPLAIVGIGCLFPKAAGPGFYWANVKNGVDCIEEVPPTHWDPSDYFDADPKSPDMTYARRGGFLSAVDFNPMEFGISPRDIEATDTSQLLGLVAAKQALTDAGVILSSDNGEARAVDRNRVSVILGVTGTLELVIPLGARLGHPKWKQAMKEAGIPDDAADDAAQRIAESYVPWQENSFPGLLGNVVAGRIANKLDLGGTNCVVDAACASSLSAVHLAALELQAGRADVVVTGGIDTFNDIFMYMCFSKTPALSATGDAKPFDANGDGTILGEGLGVVVLKRLADAERDGDTIYAVLKGIGSSSDGKGNAIYAPSSEGQKKCLRNAYAMAGVRPDTIELVEAHGTGTRVGDTAEITALAEVYSSAQQGADAPRSPKPKPWCAIGSVKSQIGHTKAAAGAASLIKTTLALHNKILPPTLKVSQPIEPLRLPDSPFYVNTKMRPWLPRAEHPRRAALSAFGFGGSNFHAVLEEYRSEKTTPDWDGTVEIASLSAETPQAVAAALDSVPCNDWDAFARFAESSRASFRSDAPCRLAFAAHRGRTDLAKLIAGAKGKLQADPAAASWHTPDGTHYEAGSTAGKVAVLFPGQGSQYVGMLRDLACLFPEMLGSLTEANVAVAAQMHENTDVRRLSDRIYPPSSFDPEQHKANDRDLRDTRNAQPAIGAVSFGAWTVLHERFGIPADAFAGHSYGELTALAAAGCFKPADLFALSRLRGDLMARKPEGDPGAMLAVRASVADIEPVLKSNGLNLVVANLNAPNQTVLSGSTSEVEKAEKALIAAGLAGVRLPVAAAFHSEFVADAAVPFRAALEGVSFAPGSAPVFANTTASPYPADEKSAKDLLANQLARPVAFIDQIRAMADSGVRTFVEVGPGAVLTRLAEAILDAGGVADAEAFAIDASGGKRPGVLDLGSALARLAARGVPVRLDAWEAGSRCRPPQPASNTGLTVPICGANYVTPRSKRPPRTVPPSAQANGVSRGARPVDPARSAKVQTMPDAPNSGEPRDSGALAQALAVTQQTLAAIQRMQEQTAQLHRQFLESQESAQRTLHALVEQQQTLLTSGISGKAVVLPPLPPMPAPAARPAPAVPPAPAQVVVPPRPAPAAVPAPPARAANVERVAPTLLEVVAEKTGYPVASLDLKLSLDSDLGVDSIKRVEILSALQERLPEAPQVKPEHLGTLHTLQDVADFLSNGQPASSGVAAVDVQSNGFHAPAVAASADVAPTLLEVVAEKTGYPVASLDLKLSLDSDLGVDSIKRVEILSALQERLPEAPQVKPEHLGTLHTLQDVADFLSNGQPASPGVAAVDVQSNGFHAPAAAASAEVAPTLLEVVAEKTGYPVATLDLKLSLDSDLGVDSIKRVEILSALQERLPEAPQVKPEHLGTLHTLQDVADFLSGRAGLPEAPATARISVVPPFIAEPDLSEPTAPLTELAPADTEPVSHVRQARMTDSVVTALRESGSSPPDTRTPPPIKTRSRSAEAVRSGKPALTDGVDRSILQPVDLDPAVPRPRLPLPPGGEVVVVGEPDVLTGQVIAQLTQKGLQVRQSVWSDVDRFEAGAATTGLILLAPVRPDPEVNRLAFLWLQRIGPKLRHAARHGATLFATVARIDGAFGLNHLSAEADPTAGGLAGLVKTARLEWPEVSCKAIDLDPAFTDTGAAAAAVADEVLAAGSIEVGIAATHRCALELARTVRRPDGAPIGLGPNDVVLITGGARGVTAEAAVALAEAYHPTLILTGRTPSPEPEPEWLAPLTSEAEIKAAIATRLAPGSGPRQIGEQYHKLVAQREVRRTLQRIEESGSRVAYFPVDVADPEAVAKLLGEVRAKFGPVTGLIHGAGVLADRRIEDLTTDDFDRVYATKVRGLRNLLQSIGGDELKVLVLFSSITARQGRIGQLAYAVANEVLNKTAQVESRRRPGCRIVALNWGPWDGGMVTPALRKQFESEGVGLISLADGAAFMVEELNAAGKAVEVLALGKPRGTGSGSFAGGQRSGTVAVPAAARRSGSAPIVSPPGPVQNLDMTVAYERAIDLESHPVLRSHVIDSRCVLPMALHVELLSHAALHGHPGLMFHGFNDLRITQGVKLDAAESVPLRAFAGKAVRQDHHFIVPVELRGKRKDGRDVVKSRAEIVLTPALPNPPAADRPPHVNPYPLPVERAYRELLFHGPDLHGIERLLGIGEMAVMGTARPAPPPAQWIQSPLRSAWVADPLVLDASFQMMILWSREQHGAASLPSFVGRYRQFRRRFEGPVAIVVRVTRDNGTFARADIDYLDADGRVIAQMQDYECMIEKSLNQAFGRNQLGVVKA